MSRQCRCVCVFPRLERSSSSCMLLSVPTLVAALCICLVAGYKGTQLVQQCQIPSQPVPLSCFCVCS